VIPKRVIVASGPLPLQHVRSLPHSTNRQSHRLHGPHAQARRAKTQGRHALSRSAWLPPSLPAWLNEETYQGKIQPLLAGVTNSAIASALGVPKPYASAVRAGRRRPHPRHWQVLAGLVGVSLEA
jgi:hypothetical protein